MTKENILKTKIAVLKEVAETIVSSDNLNSVSNLVLDLALNYTSAKTGSILLLDEKGELVVKAARGMDKDLIAALRLKIGENICGKVAFEKKPLLVKDMESDQRVPKKGAEKYETKSFISCPILMQDKLLGVINISDKIDSSAFTEDELDLITILANQAAITLENARLMSELRTKTLEMEEANKGLIEEDVLKTEFMAKISHELRTPLNSIRGAIYYLKDKGGWSKAEQTEFLEIISDETKKMISLFDGLLDFSRGEREKIKKVISLNRILRDVVKTKTIKNILADKKISVHEIYHEPIQDIIGDRSSIFQLFINLIEGSTKYTASGDSIEIRTSESDSCLEVNFTVKGRKLPEDELLSIFDSRVTLSLPSIGQKNLKFYLAKKTAELHRGSISVQNMPEGFLIKLAIPKSSIERHDVEVNELMDLLLAFIAESMGLNKCSLMLTDEPTGELTIRSAYGLDEEIRTKTRLKLGDKIAGWVALKKEPLLIKDIEKDSRISKKSSPQYNTKSLLSLPIVVDDRAIGVLNLSNKDNGKQFDTKDLYFATAVAERVAYIFSKLNRGDLTGSNFKILASRLEALLYAWRKYHKKNDMIMDLVFQIMTRLGCGDEEIGLALYAAALYDIGLTQIDDSILNKDRTLSPLEQRIIKTHPFSGLGLIDQIESSDAIKKFILHHHERYDGSGYPDGLRGDNIPLVSRVLGVVDTYSAMITDHPYRKAFTSKEAVNYVVSNAGTKFDPKVANVFGSVIQG